MTQYTAERRPPELAPRVGMVGAGQLARMTYQAGVSLGITVRLLATSLDESAALIGADVTLGSPASFGDLEAFAKDCDVVTFDHELIDPADLLSLEATGHALRPGAAAKRFAQDKLHQRERLAALGFAVPPFTHVTAAADLLAFGDRQGWPVVAKAVRGGYDGRGVWEITSQHDAVRVWEEASAAGVQLLAEAWVPIARELAVQVARRPGGEAVTYPVTETVQYGGICHEILVPAAGSAALAAADLGLRIAQVVGSTGILTIELFETTSGELVVNELAARPHNSGHYSIEGCVTSQFENHLRAVLDWPLGATDLRAPAVVTANLLGGSDAIDPRTRLTET